MASTDLLRVNFGKRMSRLVGLCAVLAIAAFAAPAVSGVDVGTGVAVAATAPAKCKGVLGGTFLQPSWSVFSWSGARYQQELSQMKATGITAVIDQWTVDMDADQAYYPDPSTWYPEQANMVGPLLSAAHSLNMTVWLGLGNVYNWQAHATDTAWLANQLYVDEQTANQIWSDYPGQFIGWYISNEVNDVLLSTPAAVGPMTWFFTSLTQYLHTHDGNMAVMTSPTYAGLNESTTAFARSVRNVLGAVDVLNVQDGGGSGYIAPSDITNWFSAMAAAFAGTHTILVQNADMFQVGGPMSPAKLQADLDATCGLVAGRTGFSFTTQMGPLDLGTSQYYNAYRAYAAGS